jgi:hypothetical protein
MLNVIKLLQHFILCNMMCYGALKSNIDRGHWHVHVFKQNVCLINFDKFLTNVKLFHVYIKVHNTTSDIGHKPAISNMFNRFEILKY